MSRFSSNTMMLVVGLAIVTVSYAVSAAPQKAAAPVEASYPLPEWATQPWTGDDKPYKKIEHEIDTAISQRKLTTADITAYETQADKNPQDPQAQFRWTYACYRAAQADPPIPVGRYPFIYALGRAPFPHSSEYARIGFLVLTQAGAEPHFLGLGERLLARNPNDYVLEYQLQGCVDPTLSPAKEKQAFQYAHDLLRMKSNDPRSYVALGSVYYYLWSDTHDRVTGQKAIAAYRRALKLGPPQKGVELANRIIAEIQHG